VLPSATCLARSPSRNASARPLLCTAGTVVIAIQPSANAGDCGKPDFSVKVTPKSNTVTIVVAKKSQLLVGSEMASSFAKKIALTLSTNSAMTSSGLSIALKAP